MRIGILTSSRADFGIYLPLINELKKDSYFKFSLIVFGTHLSKQHGYTLHEIIENGVDPRFVFEPVFFGDSPAEIAKTITATFNQFDSFWADQDKNSFYARKSSAARSWHQQLDQDGWHVQPLPGS